MARKPKSAKSRSVATEPQGRIAYAELVARIQAGDVSAREIEAWFIPDVAGQRAFAPGLRLNEAAVDVTGVEHAARAAATALGDDAAAALERGGPPLPTTAIAAAIAKAGVVAEGDSWFDLPDIFYPKTAIDILRQSMDVVNLAHFGDELAGMIASGQYVPYLAAGGVRHLLFSAGGNDVLGNIRQYLRVRASGDHDPSNAHRYLRPEFADKITAVLADYGRLAQQVRQLAPSTVLIVHGYDYALPRRFGAWLGTPLAEFGFDPVDEKPLARAIIRHMLDAYNARLALFVAQNTNMAYVDLRGLLAETDWFGDELHPGESGACKIAKALKKKIAETALVG